jgi:putative Mg2+ transporter-C (MgtC) family protein
VPGPGTKDDQKEPQIMILNDWVVILRLLLAAILSGAVGFEREFHGRAAGFRTHILLCLGSTLVMLTSIHIFDVYIARVACDPARIAAGVVTGVGFLGAGAIMQTKASVKGLTTAASLWVVAGIGLAVGSGLYFGAIFTTILTLVALYFFSRLEHVMIRRDWFKTIVVETKDGAEQLKAVREVLADHGASITDFDAHKDPDTGNMVIRLGLKLATARHDDYVVRDISGLEGVKRVKWEAE